MKPTVYQVKSDWTVFRMPERDVEAFQMYEDIAFWLDQNCSGPYKVFLMSHGENATFYKHGKRSKELNRHKYQPLVQVDIQYKKDAMLFKMAWQ